MTKKEAIKLVLDYIVRRIPDSHHEGFLPSDEVYKAIELLQEKKQSE